MVQLHTSAVVSHLLDRGIIKNNNKIILDLCGGTGAWGKPWIDAGFDVKLITLPDYDVTKAFWANGHISFPKLTGADGERPTLRIAIKDIYGVLAAPPCTEFSKAKTPAPRDFEKGMETIEACLKIIWAIQKQHKLDFWALENPEGLLSRFLGNPPYHFEQWWFGNDRSKKTHLWGRFIEPKRFVFQKPDNYQKATHNGNSDWYSNSSAAVRAITPAGFAQAFYNANK